MKKTVKVLRVPRAARIATRNGQDYPKWIVLPETVAEATVSTFLFGRKTSIADFNVKELKPFFKEVEIPEEELEPHMTVVG